MLSLILDTEAHPRILERMLAVASRPALIGMRATSHAVRDRADALLGKHLWLQMSRSDADIDGLPMATLTTPDGRHPAFCPRESNWMAKNTTATDQLAHCEAIIRGAEVIDMTLEDSCSDAYYDVIQPQLNKGNVKALRWVPNQGGTFGTYWGFDGVEFPVETMVVFHGPYNGVKCEESIGSPKPPPHTKKVIQHFFYSDVPYAAVQTQGRYPYRDGAPTVPEKVFVFSGAEDTFPVPDIENRVDIVPGQDFERDPSFSARMRGHRRVDNYRAYCYETLSLGGSCTVVGLDEVPLFFLGYTDEMSTDDVIGDFMAALAHDLLKERVEFPRTLGFRGKRGPPPNGRAYVAETMRRLRFMTRAQYAATLSSEQHAVEGVIEVRPGKRRDVFACAPTQRSKVTESRSTTASPHAPVAPFNLELYPHIIDLIAFHSSAPTLVQLSAANKMVAAAVAKQFAHVWMVPSVDQRTFRLHNESGPLPGFDAFSIRPAPNVHEMDDYEDGPLHHRGPWEIVRGEYPPMPWPLFKARLKLLGHIKVLNYPAPLLAHLGPVVLGMKELEVVRMSLGHMVWACSEVQCQIHVVYCTPRIPMENTPQHTNQMIGPFATFEGCKRVVIHMLFAERQRRFLWPGIREYGLGPKVELVYVFTPFDPAMHPVDWTGPTDASDEFEDDDPYVRRESFVYSLSDILAEAYKRGHDCSVTLVNIHAAARWLGFAGTANTAASIEAEITAEVTKGVRRFCRFAPGGGPSLSNARVDELTQAAMKLSFVSREEYSARQDVHPAEKDIELVPGQRHQLLPDVKLWASGRPTGNE